MSLRRLTALPVAGTAVAGVVAGHAMTYVVAVRQPAHRSDILDVTGHSYWAAAVALAVVLGVGAVVAVGLRALRRPVAQSRDPHRFAMVAPRLAAVQVLAYVTIELVERLLTGTPVSELLDHHELLPVGTAIQIVVALAGALLLHLLARTLRLVAAALRAPRRRRPFTAPALAPSAAPSLRSRALRSAWGLRGPPEYLAALAGR